MKLDLVEGGISTPATMEQNASLSALASVPCITVDNECRDNKVRIFNGADAVVVQNTFQCIVGMAYTW